MFAIHCYLILRLVLVLHRPFLRRTLKNQWSWRQRGKSRRGNVKDNIQPDVLLFIFCHLLPFLLKLECDGEKGKNFNLDYAFVEIFVKKKYMHTHTCSISCFRLCRTPIIWFSESSGVTKRSGEGKLLFSKGLRFKVSMIPELAWEAFPFLTLLLSWQWY